MNKTSWKKIQKYCQQTLKVLLLLLLFQGVLFYQSSPTIINLVKINQITPNLAFLILFGIYLTYPPFIVYLSIILMGMMLDFLSAAPPMFYIMTFSLSLMPAFFLYQKFFHSINLLNFLILVLINLLSKIIIETILIFVFFDYENTLYYLREIGFYELFINMLFAIPIYLIFFTLIYISNNKKGTPLSSFINS